MTATAHPRFDLAFEPAYGKAVPVAPGVVRVTAPNSGPYTFAGTNTFLVGERRVAVIDPGPDLPGHRAALAEAIAGRSVEAIFLTHTHTDHSGLASWLRTHTGALLLFGGPHRLSRPLRPGERNDLAGSSDWALMPDYAPRDGEVLHFAEGSIGVIATPGHCANHLCFTFEGTGVMFSGDHVMAWNSSLVAPPDGSMADYLGSLDRVAAAPCRTYLPAHGGTVADGPAHAQALKAHRELRSRQMVDAVLAGARDPEAIVARLYPALDGNLVAAAAMTVGAHLELLAELGEIRLEADGNALRAEPV